MLPTNETPCPQYTTIAFLERRVTLLGLAKTWGISFFANMAGVLFFCFPICIYGGVFSSASSQAHAVSYAIGKAQDPGWYQILLSAMGCESHLLQPVLNNSL